MKQAMKPIENDILRSIWEANGNGLNSVQIGLQPFSTKKKPLEHSKLLLFEAWLLVVELPAVVSRTESDVDTAVWLLPT